MTVDFQMPEKDIRVEFWVFSTWVSMTCLWWAGWWIKRIAHGVFCLVTAHPWFQCKSSALEDRDEVGKPHVRRSQSANKIVIRMTWWWWISSLFSVLLLVVTCVDIYIYIYSVRVLRGRRNTLEACQCCRVVEPLAHWQLDTWDAHCLGQREVVFQENLRVPPTMPTLQGNISSNFFGKPLNKKSNDFCFHFDFSSRWLLGIARAQMVQFHERRHGWWLMMGAPAPIDMAGHGNHGYWNESFSNGRG